MTDLSAKDLAALSKAATEGEWFYHDFTGATPIPTAMDVAISCDHPAHITVASMGGGFGGSGDLLQASADARFIIALVNAYRAGKLVHVDRLRALVKMWREEARLLEGSSDTWCRSAKAIGYLCADELVAIIGEKSE